MYYLIDIPENTSVLLHTTTICFASMYPIFELSLAFSLILAPLPQRFTYLRHGKTHQIFQIFSFLSCRLFMYCNCFLVVCYVAVTILYLLAVDNETPSSRGVQKNICHGSPARVVSTGTQSSQPFLLPDNLTKYSMLSLLKFRTPKEQ